MVCMLNDHTIGTDNWKLDAVWETNTFQQQYTLIEYMYDLSNKHMFIKKYMHILNHFHYLSWTKNSNRAKKYAYEILKRGISIITL